MNHEEELFLSTLEDIRNKIIDENKYKYLRACGMLRQILLDKPSLLDHANKKHRIKFKFEVNEKESPDNIFLAQWVDPGCLDGKSLAVNTQQFLRRRIFTLIDMHFTIKDFIRSSANVKGGVHSYTPLNDEERILSVLDEKVFKSQSLGLKSIKSICEITLKAVEPLEQMILGHTPAGGF
jgi:hypothetical protein